MELSGIVFSCHALVLFIVHLFGRIICFRFWPFFGGSKEEERSVFFLSFSISFVTFCVCLFFSFFATCIFPFYSYFFGLSAFVPSAFYYSHFSIRIRHPQISGPRFTDTPLTPVKIRERLNPFFVASEIRNLMRSRDR